MWSNLVTLETVFTFASLETLFQLTFCRWRYPHERPTTTTTQGQQKQTRTSFPLHIRSQTNGVGKYKPENTHLLRKRKYHFSRVAAIAPWFCLRLPSCSPRFESQAHHLCFFSICIEIVTRKELKLTKRGRDWPTFFNKWTLRAKIIIS